jgi:hypothetical protein
MNLYTIALSAHVVTAVLGVGQVVATAQLAGAVRRGLADGASTPALTTLRR